MAVLTSPHTAVHLVTLLEEMPVQETVDGVADLRAAGLPVGGIVINMVRDAAARPAGAGQGAARRRRRARLRRTSSSPASPAGRGRPTPSTRRSTRCSTRRRPRASESRWSRRSAPGCSTLERPMFELPLAARRRRPRRALYELAEPAPAGRGMTGPTVRPVAACRRAPPTLDVDALLADPATASSCAAAPAGSARPPRRRRWPARGRAGPQGRRAHHRPGPAAGPVDGPDRARQHAAAGHGSRHADRRLARTR